MTNITKAALLSSLVSILVLAGVAQKTGGGRQPMSLYEPLPQAERVPFREGLERILFLHKSGKWSELYDYLDTDLPVSKQQFVQRMSDGDSLIEFRPDAITYIPPADSWLVTGCAEFKKPSGRVFFAFSSIRGRHTVQGWRFTDVAIEMIKGKPHGIRSCRI